MGRHKAEQAPGWIRAALDAASRPRRSPVGGFVMAARPDERRSRGQTRRGDHLAVPGLQLVRASMHPVLPRQRLTDPHGVAAQVHGDLTYGDRCAVCGHPHVETAPCFVEAPTVTPADDNETALPEPLYET